MVRAMPAEQARRRARSRPGIRRDRERGRIGPARRRTAADGRGGKRAASGSGPVARLGGARLVLGGGAGRAGGGRGGAAGARPAAAPAPRRWRAAPAPAPRAGAARAAGRAGARRARAPPPAAGRRPPASRRPIAALLEPAPDVDGAVLPRIGPDGRMPMQVYAAAVRRRRPAPARGRAARRHRHGGADSEDAIRATPAAVSLAFSPYAPRPDPLLERRARRRPRDAGVDPDGAARLPAERRRQPRAADRRWRRRRTTSGWSGRCRASPAMSARPAAMSGLRGERFAASEQMRAGAGGTGRARPAVHRPAPGGGAARRRGAGAPGRRAVDVVIDDPPVRAEIEASAGAAGAAGARPRQRARPGRAARPGDGGAARRLGRRAGRRAASCWCRSARWCRCRRRPLRPAAEPPP